MSSNLVYKTTTTDDLTGKKYPFRPEGREKKWFNTVSGKICIAVIALLLGAGVAVGVYFSADLLMKDAVSDAENPQISITGSSPAATPPNKETGKENSTSLKCSAFALRRQENTTISCFGENITISHHGDWNVWCPEGDFKTKFNCSFLERGSLGNDVEVTLAKTDSSSFFRSIDTVVLGNAAIDADFPWGSQKVFCPQFYVSLKTDVSCFTDDFRRVSFSFMGLTPQVLLCPQISFTTHYICAGELFIFYGKGIFKQQVIFNCPGLTIQSNSVPKEYQCGPKKIQILSNENATCEQGIWRDFRDCGNITFSYSLENNTYSTTSSMDRVPRINPAIIESSDSVY
jgi:hypothetical protein